MATEKELRKHLEDRHMDLSRYSGVYFGDDVVIFSLWNLSGQMVGYQQYRKDAEKEAKNHPREGRYYTSIHGKKYEKPLAVWGLESLCYDPRILVIVEGIFDAVRLHNRDVPAIALLSSSHKHYKSWLNSLGRKIYKVEDDHGSSLGPYAPLIIPPGVEDLGACTEEQLTTVTTQLEN